MSHIILKNVHLAYPVLQANARSLRHSMLKATTGGLLTTENKKIVVTALSDMSFVFSDGDRVGLIGHNGAGKSTLLKLLSGIYHQQAGQVDIDGAVSSLLDLAYGIEPEATGIENIRFRCRINGIARKQIPAIIKDVADFSEMGDYLKMPAKTYSDGMILRLSFALSTAIKPTILLLDEIIGAGDARFREKAQLRLRDLVLQSDILLLSSHDNDMIRQFCNKALWLEHGKIRLLGDVEPVLQAYETDCQQFGNTV